MAKRLVSVLATMATAAAVSTVLAQPAHANFIGSNTNGCTKIEVSYTHNGPTTRWVDWIRSSNRCGPYRGHFNTNGVDDVERNPIATHTINWSRQVDRGEIFCSIGWKNNGDRYINMGGVCWEIS